MTDFDLPPHDIEAEEAVLGAAMVDPDQIPALAAVVRPSHFFREKHAWVLEAVEALYQRDGKLGVNAVTIAHELAAHDRLEGIGGQTFLHDVIRRLPTSVGAVFYAEIVRETAARRDIIRAAQQALRAAYGGETNATEILEGAVNDLMRIGRDAPSASRAQTAPEVLYEGGLNDAIMSHLENPRRLLGISTGYKAVDMLLDGLQAGNVYIVAAETSVGKALALDTPIATRSGWSTMGELRRGDVVFGADGKPCNVTATTDVMYDRECFEVEFADGTVIVADAEHQWMTETWGSRMSAYKARTGKNRQRNQQTFAAIRTTREIRDTLLVAAAGRSNHAVAVAGALHLPEIDLPIPPYVLGAWLGDGGSHGSGLTCFDEQIVEEIAKDWPTVRRSRPHQATTTPVPGRFLIKGLKPRLVEMGLILNKHIPPIYLRASERQRLALLQGLMDTDGYVAKTGQSQLALTSRPLALGAFELITGLGLRPRLRTKQVKGRRAESSTCYMINFTTERLVFRLDRKRARLPKGDHPRTRSNYIADVRPVPSVPVRCIEVDSPDHMYLAGPTMIPTHNSLFCHNLLWKLGNAMVRQIIFSSEMTRRSVGKRLAYIEAGVDPQAARNRGYYLPEEKAEVMRAIRWFEELGANVHFHAGSQAFTSMRLEARRVKSKYGLDVLLLDHIDHVAGKGSGSKASDLEELMGDLKGLAEDLQVPIVAVSHLSRDSSVVKRSKASRLKNSSAKEQDADVLIFLQPVEWDHGTNEWIELSHEKALADRVGGGSQYVRLEVFKNREGMTGIVPLRMSWQRGGRYYEVIPKGQQQEAAG